MGGCYILEHLFTSVPPVGELKVRALHPREDDELDEKQFPSWVREAAAVPGWDP